MRRGLLGALALACAMSSAFAADWPPATLAKIETAAVNMLSLERPESIGLVTVFDGNKFVQCRRQDDRAIRCEAAGALLQPSLAHTLTGARIESLEAFGWTLDPAFGNYVQTFPADADAKRLASEIQLALSEGYAADPELIEARTDWVKKEPCPPRAGRTQNLAGSINDSRALALVAIHACDYKPPGGGELRFSSGDVNELVAAYGARVTGELQRLRVNHDRHVFFILDTGIGYAQCATADKPPSHYCEAPSADVWPALASITTPDRIARLHAIGFEDPGRAPNYWRNYALDKFDDAAVARELLTVLHDVYGYRGTPKLKVVTEKGGD